ncbi:MAG: winged helix DNA-binding domain-containing protein [Bifidobacteriaceae bacterium]|nr:winged helix DNA-binding domain-containing protein [Bifidobacteriaceae bacterium]
MIRNAQVLPLRLRALGLAGRAHSDPARVAAHFLALQGQDFWAARWALGLRSGAGEEAVRAAFDCGDLVRGWPMRGTLHVMAAADALWLQRLDWELSGAGAAERRLADLPHSPRDWSRALDAAAEALDAGPLSRAELVAVAARALAARGAGGGADRALAAGREARADVGTGAARTGGAGGAARPSGALAAAGTRGADRAPGGSDSGRAGGPSAAGGEASGARREMPRGVPAGQTWGAQSPEQRMARRLLTHLVGAGIAVFGPTRGTEQLLALAETWIPAPRRLDLEEALAEIATGFVRSHGPATERDLARWAGRSLGEARRGIAAAGDRVVRVPGENGVEWLVAPDALDAPQDWDAPGANNVGATGARVLGSAGAGVAAGHDGLVPGANNASAIDGIVPGGKDGIGHRAQGVPGLGVRLLPAFDEHVLGYANRSAQLRPADEPLVVPGRNGVFKPTVTVDGVAVGTWSAPGPAATARLGGDRPVPISVAPFDRARGRKLGRRALAAAAQEYAAYLGRPGAEVALPSHNA